MHDYTANILHDDRMRTLRREAADSRLARKPPATQVAATQVPATQAPATEAARRPRGFGIGLVLRTARISGWARRNAPTHGFGGSLRAATDAQLAKDA
jgi:hypothetical protein